eukprot:m.269579 g.269579  ORF g.269579 m.269579 type:complete len:282 (-) comp54745_c0_seq4:130-975(-)
MSALTKFVRRLAIAVYHPTPAISNPPPQNPAVQAAAVALVSGQGVGNISSQLLLQAFTPHAQSPQHSNRRLATLGEAVVSSAVVLRAFQQHPHLPAYALRALRSYALSPANIKSICDEIGVGQVVSGWGTTSDAESERESLHALVGALVLDQGSAAAHAFVNTKFASILDKADIKSIAQHAAPKVVLNAILKPDQQLNIFNLRVTSEDEEESVSFACRVLAGETQIGQADAPTRKVAEQNALKQALQHYSEQLKTAELPTDQQVDAAFRSTVTNPTHHISA